MTKAIAVSLEPLTAQAFAPFGQVIGQQDGPPVFSGPHIKSWRMDFAVDGNIELMFARYVHQPFAFTQMERHFNVTQSFISMDGAASVMAVAPPTDPDDPASVPAPGDIRAFYVGGDIGVMLWRGTWHALTRFPAQPPGADFALITGAATQRELERQLADGTKPKHTEVVDFAASEVSVEVIDPQELIARP